MAKPPISLTKLYNDLEFLGGIGDNQKYSFGERKYTNNDYFATVFRAFRSESQDVNGILNMENICTDAIEQYKVYIDHKVFGKKLLDSIIKARHGLSRCVTTYRTLQRLTTATNIETRAIFLLDNIIPEDRKISEGIIHKKSISTEVNFNEPLEEININ